MPEPRPTRIRWWPIVVLTGENRPPDQRWALKTGSAGGKKALLLVSPRGRAWVVRTGARHFPGISIVPVDPTNQPTKSP